MPELPEVEHLRRRFAALAQGATISSVDALPDPIVFTQGTTHTTFMDYMRGAIIDACDRWGKYMYTRIRPADTGAPTCYWFLHLGMTGSLRIRGLDNTTYLSSNIQYDADEWPPKYAKFWFTLMPATAGPPTCVAFCDPRRLGKCFFVHAESPDRVRTLPPLSLLGFDPLLGMPSLADFSALLARRSAGSPLKAVLLDQGFAAGVGNWIADEVLYQAGVHPQSPVGAVVARTDLVAKVHAALRDVVVTACEVGPGGYPEDWLFHYRWAKKSTRGQAAAKDARGRRVEFVTVGGRTAAYVPEVQFKITASGANGRASDKPRGDGCENHDESELSSLDEDEELGFSQPAPVVDRRASLRSRTRPVVKRGPGEEAEGSGGSKRIKARE